MASLLPTDYNLLPRIIKDEIANYLATQKYSTEDVAEICVNNAMSVTLVIWKKNKNGKRFYDPITDNGARIMVMMKDPAPHWLAAIVIGCDALRNGS